MPATTAIIALVTAFISESQQSRGGSPATWGLSDQELWAKVISGQDPLAGMSIKQAVRLDPRRIDAAIRQAYYLAMHEGIPSDPQSRRFDEALYLMGLDLVRRHSGRKIRALPLVSIHEESWYKILAGTARTWPPQLKRYYQDNWDRIAAGFRQGQDIARQAMFAAGEQNLLEDAREWKVMADVLGEMRDGLYLVITTGTLPELPERVQQRAMLPGPAPTGAPQILDVEEYGRLYARGLRNPPPGGFTGSSTQGHRGSRYGRLYARGLREPPPGGFTGSASQGYRGSRY